MKKNLFIFALPFVAFLIVCVFFLLALDDDPTHLPSAKLNKPIPNFELPLLNKPDVLATQDDLKGQVALLNVWATWCPSCKYEHPKLNELAAAGVRIFGLNYKDDRESALAYLVRGGDPYSLTIFDELGDLGLDLGVYGAPETYVVDANGVIQYRLSLIHISEPTRPY